MEEKENCYQRDDYRLFDELSAKRADSGLNQAGAVVAANKANALRERSLNSDHLLLDCLDHGKGIRTEPHHDPTRDDLAFPIEVRDAPSEPGTHLDIRDVA